MPEPVLSLAHLTVLDLAPPEVIDVAAATGCKHVGLRLLPIAPGAIAYDLMNDTAMMCETLARLGDTGVSVFDLEIVMLKPDTDVSRLIPFFEAGVRLGAKHVLVAGYDPDEARLTATFASFCEAAASFGLTGDLEFMPWTDVPELASEALVAAAAAQPNGGVLVDALHFDRSGSTIADIAAVPRARLHYWQICDALAERPATTEGMLHTARAERLFPGKGGIDLIPLIQALPNDIPIGLEIPMVTLARTLGPVERVRRAVAATRRLLARADDPGSRTPN